MTQREKIDIKGMLGISVGALIMFSPILIGYIYDRSHPVSTLTGHDALLQIHRYLGCLMLQLIAMPFAFALSGFVGSLICRAGNEEYKDKRKWSPAAVIILAVLGTVVMLLIPRVSGFDLQEELNGYKGPPIVRIAKLYNACGKDIKNGAVRSIEIDSAETGYDIFTYRKAGTSKGSHQTGYSSQYSLNNGEGPVAQISKSDGSHMEMLFMTRNRHSAELYENSGLIASLDGYDNMLFDYSELFTIDYDGEYLRRTFAEDESKLKELSLYMEYDGEQTGDILVGSKKQLYFPNVKKGSSGYLRIWYNGEPVRVSNIIEF